jgi:hypothetical protein
LDFFKATLRVDISYLFLLLLVDGKYLCLVKTFLKGTYNISLGNIKYIYKDPVYFV